MTGPERARLKLAAPAAADMPSLAPELLGLALQDHRFGQVRLYMCTKARFFRIIFGLQSLWRLLAVHSPSQNVKAFATPSPIAIAGLRGWPTLGSVSLVC